MNIKLDKPKMIHNWYQILKLLILRLVNQINNPRILEVGNLIRLGTTSIRYLTEIQDQYNNLQLTTTDLKNSTENIDTGNIIVLYKDY